MTIEQYRNFEEQIVDKYDSSSSLEEILEEAEQAKKDGLVLSKNQVFEFFDDEHRF